MHCQLWDLIREDFMALLKLVGEKERSIPVLNQDLKVEMLEDRVSTGMTGD